MELTPRRRVLAILACLVVLGGLFVWAGTIDPDAGDNNYPTAGDIHDDPAAFVGQQVQLDGTVTATDPLTIVAEPIPGDTREYEISGLAIDVAVGDQVSAFGTLESESHLAATSAHSRESWEVYYMYVISFLAGLWVLGRIVNRWRIDTEAFALVPRDRPRYRLRSD